MTFEEFFKKKKISTEALKMAEPALYAEFENHFAQMGEKSFDHTKKYWFNKLRLQYPAPVEQKTEKVKIDNPLAEQTITDSLEQAVVSPKPGFTPRFKAAVPKPPEEQPVEKKPAEETVAPNPAAPKPGFTPRFKAANMPATSNKSEEKAIENPDHEKPTEGVESPAPSATKPGFTPRFKAANMPKPAETPTEEKSTELPLLPEIPATDDAPKPAYKPRFNPKSLPKKEE